MECILFVQEQNFKTGIWTLIFNLSVLSHSVDLNVEIDIILYCFFWISPPSSQSTKSFILLFSRNICRVGELRWGRIVTEVSNQCAGHFTSNTSTKPLMSGSIPPAPTLALIFLPTVRHWQYSWMHIQFLYVQRNNMYHEKLQWGYSLKETRYLILALPLAKDIFSILFHSVASKKIN